MMWCATWLTSATSLPSRRTIVRLTSPQSSPTSARRASRDGIVGVVSASDIVLSLPLLPNPRALRSGSALRRGAANLGANHQRPPSRTLSPAAASRLYQWDEAVFVDP